MAADNDEPLPFKMEDLTNLCKKKGFVFQSSEIYSPLAGFFDYGPMGVELKNNIKKLWWRDMVQRREDIVGLDSSIISSPAIWKASGHVAGFSDPMVGPQSDDSVISSRNSTFFDRLIAKSRSCGTELTRSFGVNLNQKPEKCLAMLL